MSISRLLALYGFSVVVFLSLDYFWLTRMVPRFYKPLLGHLLAAEPRLAVAGLFYLVYVVGILYFAVWPSLQSGSVLQAVVRGALFGFFTYATYDLTNQATLRDWPWQVSALDIAWGTCLNAMVAWTAFLAGRWWGS